MNNALEIRIDDRSAMPMGVRSVARLMRAAANALGFSRGEISVIALSPQAIIARAGRFLKHKKAHVPTILAFPYLQKGSYAIADILVCPNAIRNEAVMDGMDPKRRLAQLLIHAMVHVKGFNHDTQKSFRRMESVERRLRRSLL